MEHRLRFLLWISNAHRHLYPIKRHALAMSKLKSACFTTSNGSVALLIAGYSTKRCLVAVLHHLTPKSLITFELEHNVYLLSQNQFRILQYAHGVLQ